MSLAFIERRRAERDAEDARLLEEVGWPFSNGQLTRFREAEATEEREIDAYWTRYAELSTREQIRQRGLVSWTCNTTPGILLAIAVQLLVVWLLAHLL